MTESGTLTAAAEARARREPKGTGGTELRRSAAIRAGSAVLIAGAVTAAAIVLLWSPLGVRTDVVGYPVFADFNPYNYFWAFYLTVGLFPIAALLLFLGLTRVGPRINLPVPPSRGKLRPSPQVKQVEPALEDDPPLDEAPAIRRRMGGALRVAFVGAVIGLEVGIASNHIWRGLALGFVIYALVVILATAVLNRRGPRGWSFEQRLAAVNSAGAPLSIAGLIAVSASTEVRILANGSANHYPWFPVWLGVPAAGALLAWVVSSVRRAGASGVWAIERRTLILIAAPVAIFLLVAVLPGDSASIDTFDAGQGLVANRLVGGGWLPWRDIVLAHGLLLDVFGPAIGFTVFGNSYWGHIAGNTVLVNPLYLVSMYFLFVYLFGRRSLFLVLSGLILIGTVFAPPDFRFILWPFVLLLLAAVLNRPTPLRSVALGFLAVGQAIVTPESAPALLGVAVVLVGYEWYWRRPGTGIVSAFPRTLWFAGAGVALAGAFALYLASRGALNDFAYITRNLVRGHTVDGALPPAPNAGTVSRAQFDFLALAPPAALVISFAYAVVRVRLRRPFLTQDWVMAAVAIFVLLYYPKFLSRMDTGHVLEPFGIALPLVLFILYRAVTAIEQLIRNRLPDNLMVRLCRHPATLALIVLLAALTWGTFRDRLTNAPANYRPAAVASPRFERVGYTQAFDGTGYRDLQRVINAYLSPGDRLFDLTDEPALFYYFMDRFPSTRYFEAATVVDTATLQEDTIRLLRQKPPKLIVLDNTSTTILGLSNVDGVPNMVRLYEISQWILDHYRPLLTSHGHTIYARRDLPVLSKVHLHLSQKPVSQGVPFQTQPCTWQYAPTFLSGPGEPPPGAASVRIASGPVSHPQATISGWAGDQKAKAPAREVIATVGARVVAHAVPTIDRPDLPAGGYPAGFAHSGFHMQVPAADLRKPSTVHLYGIARDGSVAELASETSASPRGSIRLDGRTVHLQPTAVAGHVDGTLGAPTMQIDLPPSSRWTDYRWLEIDAGKAGFRQGTFSVFDRQSRPSPGREISFQTLDRSPHRYVIPVGSCAQWHGYRSRRLFLAISPHQDISGVRLIR